MRDAFVVAGALIAVLFAVLGLDFIYRSGLDGLARAEAASATIRNAGLVVGGVAAIVLAGWRSYTAKRQADAAHEQVAAAERDSLDNRYQRAAAMLGDESPAVRMAGADALYFLGLNHPDRYAALVRMVLANFVQVRRKEEQLARDVVVVTGDGRKVREGPPDAAHAEEHVSALTRQFGPLDAIEELLPKQ